MAAFADLSFGRARRLTAGHTNHEHPAWSPDGRFLAFAAGPPGATDIFLADRKGRLARRLTSGPGDRSQPTFAPDGVRVAYRAQATPSGPWEVHELALFDDQAPRCVLRDPRASYHHPSYSPDGRFLAYLSDEGSPGNFHLWLLDREAGGRRALTSDASRNDGHPAWSPDGRQIAFHAYEGLEAERSSVYVLNATSGALARLTDGPGFAKHPAFVGDDAVIFHRDRPGGEQGVFLARVARRREVQLSDARAAAKHPAPHVTRKGCVRVAYAARAAAEAAAPGAPRWYDLYVAEVEGLRV